MTELHPICACDDNDDDDDDHLRGIPGRDCCLCDCSFAESETEIETETLQMFPIYIS